MGKIKDNFWKDKNVFITGASGFVGSWLTQYLVEKNANVSILLRDIVPESYLFLSGYINRVNIINGSLEDHSSIQRVLNEYEISTIFHMGAQAIVGTANRNPLSTFESNIKGTWNVLECARNSDLIERVIVATSDKAYGTQKNLPYLENMPLQGENPYEVSKSCADLISQAYFKTYGLPVSIVRCGNIYGGGDLNFNRIIPSTIRSVLFKESPIIRSDGKFVRDYIYVDDVVDAYTSIAEHDSNKTDGEAFNFSGGEKINVIDLVNMMLKLMKSNLKPVILNKVKNEIREQYLSSTKARNVLGWRPKNSLEEGLKKTIKWYEKYFRNKNNNAIGKSSPKFI